MNSELSVFDHAAFNESQPTVVPEFYETVIRLYSELARSDTVDDLSAYIDLVAGIIATQVRPFAQNFGATIKSRGHPEPATV